MADFGDPLVDCQGHIDEHGADIDEAKFEDDLLGRGQVQIFHVDQLVDENAGAGFGGWGRPPAAATGSRRQWIVGGGGGCGHFGAAGILAFDGFRAFTILGWLIAMAAARALGGFGGALAERIAGHGENQQKEQRRLEAHFDGKLKSGMEGGSSVVECASTTGTK